MIQCKVPWGSVTNNSIFFSISIDDNYDIVVDDVIEDEEDIEISGWQADYYNLINEIKNPGSTSKGKNITLYTARPTKDRQFYQETKTLPNGIYLTNNLRSAEGLATDLGLNEVRDIWKVKINSKYLLKTLDGIEKQYRIVAEEFGAPIIGNMELI